MDRQGACGVVWVRQLDECKHVPYTHHKRQTKQELISATRSSLLLKMSSVPQSPLAQSPHAAANHRHSGRVFAFNAAPGGKALVMTPRGSLPRTYSVLGDGSISNATSAAAGGGAVGGGKMEEEVLCDEAFVTIGACLEVSMERTETESDTTR